eukprot:Nk52_evm14s1444 gene=Nk52_evmTU14s1444
MEIQDSGAGESGEGAGPSEEQIIHPHHWMEPHSIKLCVCSISGRRNYFSKNYRKCAACHLTCHKDYFEEANDKISCRPSFSSEFSMDREHHWVSGNFVHTNCSKCKKKCGRLMPPSQGPPYAYRCSWCKMTIHAKCKDSLPDNFCDLGRHGTMMVPHNSIRVSGEISSEDENSVSNVEALRQTMPSSMLRNFDAPPSFVFNHSKEHLPLIVFINPKSGESQGFALYNQFKWLLNSCQVFDITKNGPAFGLSIYKNVPGHRILCCGGDGTVGWVLSELDKIHSSVQENGTKPLFRPAIGILPLGTGNDLSRVMGWGPGYAGESVKKIMRQIEEADCVGMDRWDLSVHVDPNYKAEAECETLSLPLDVVNNYFSVGTDARTTMMFHLAREKAPKKYKSRTKNKLYHAMVGAGDVFKRNCKDLPLIVEKLICDDVDYTPYLAKHKLESVLFLNIQSYASGTNPWGTKKGKFKQAHFGDGLIEVLGSKGSWDLAMQAIKLSSGVRICQCKKAFIKTNKSMFMQIDGEPCFMAPCEVQLTFRNRVFMLKKWNGKGRKKTFVDVAEQYTVENDGEENTTASNRPLQRSTSTPV